MGIFRDAQKSIFCENKLTFTAISINGRATPLVTLAKSFCNFIGIDDGYDTSHSGWELLAGIKNILNEQYIRDLGKVVRRRQVENIMQGFSTVDLCFDYKSEPIQENRVHRQNQTVKKRYVIDEEKTVWGRRIFDWYVNENRSLQWIAKELTRLNVPKDHHATTSRWYHRIVHRILSNKKYLGTWERRKKRSEYNVLQKSS